MTGVAAIFDFDHTLLRGDSARIGFHYLWDEGLLPLPYVLKASFAHWLSERRLISPERLARLLFTYYRGRDLAYFRNGAAAFYETRLKPLLCPTLLNRLERHRLRGDRIVLLSASVDYMLKPAAEDLRVDDLVCSVPEETPDGIATGRPLGSPCMGRHKLEYAQDLAVTRGFDLSRSWAYADHFSDLPLLQAVGHPVAVSPHPRLRPIALRHSWEILERD